MQRTSVLPYAWTLFRQRGYEQVSLSEIASAAGLSLAQLLSLFSSKEDFVVELYRLLATLLEETSVDMPVGSLSERFCFLMDAKIAQLSLHRPLLQALFSKMLDRDDALGVLSGPMEGIRRRVRAVFLSAVLGATDQQLDPILAARHLYRVHLALVFLWFQSPAAYRGARALVPGALDLGAPLLALPGLHSTLASVDRLLARTVGEPQQPEVDLATEILSKIFAHRRLEPGFACQASPCPECFVLHRDLLAEAVRQGRPIQMVLPGFPAKSPNRSKTLGSLPDTAEHLALRYLQRLCDELTDIHPPGVELILCSDGHVFGDLVGVSDDEISSYNQALRDILCSGNFPSLRFFNLNDLFDAPNYPEIRASFLEAYSDSLEQLRSRVHAQPSQRRLFDGLHRFLFEDRVVLFPEVSRNKQRTISKELAYQLLQRSNAWGRLVGQQFPRALRLSIHPQSPHSEKIGIQLTSPWENSDAWLTPWHASALIEGDRSRLIKRHQAEALGACVVLDGERPVHFQLPG